MSERRDEGLACVDPGIGERILDLALPTLDARQREILEAHRDVCAHCRLTLEVEREMREGLRDGSLEVDVAPRPARRRRPGWMGLTAAAAVAAGFVLMIALPPRAIGPVVHQRGADETRFVRPAEGEVVRLEDLSLEWTAVPGAGRYRVRVTGFADGSVWTGVSEETRLVLPRSIGLAADETYRAMLSTVPEDLLPPGAASVSFRTGNLGAFISHRVRHANRAGHLVALTGMALAAVCVIRRRS